MKLLYIDESHDKKTYALCGFLINDINYRKLNFDFNKFLKKEFGLEEDQELKGDELFNGRNFWKETTLDERNEIVCKIIDFLQGTKGTNFLLTCSAVQKENQHELYFVLLEPIIEKSASIVSKLGKTNRQLLIVFDERQDFRKDKAVYYEIAEKKLEIIKKHKKSCAVIDYGYEGISKFSRMLQIADFIAYFFRNYCSISEKSTLFENATDDRKIAMLKDIFENKLKQKCSIIKIKK
jgi:hypothetical protein